MSLGGFFVRYFTVMHFKRKRLAIRSPKATAERRGRTQSLVNGLSRLSGTPREMFFQARELLAEWPLVVGKKEGPVYAAMRPDEIEQVLRVLPTELNLREIARIYFDLVIEGTYQEMLSDDSEEILYEVFPGLGSRGFDVLLPMDKLVSQRKEENFSLEDFLEMSLDYAGRISLGQLEDFLFMFVEWYPAMSSFDTPKNPWHIAKLRELREAWLRLRPSENQKNRIESMMKDFGAGYADDTPVASGRVTAK